MLALVVLAAAIADVRSAESPVATCDLSRRRKIYQYSPIRSGSTMVYSILLRLFGDNHTVVKTHKLQSGWRAADCVVSTVRMPLDSICSSILRSAPHGASSSAAESRPDDTTLWRHVSQFRDSGGDGLLALYSDETDASGAPARLLLRYETFYDDLEFVFEEIEKFFRMSVSQKTRAELSATFDVKRVYEMTESSNFGARVSVDPDAPNKEWHGSHVSSHLGAVGYSRDMMTLNQQRDVRAELAPFLEHFGYSANDSEDSSDKLGDDDGGDETVLADARTLLGSYAALHGRSTDEIIERDLCTRRYVIAPFCSDGLGNCLNMLLNAYAIAAVLNRTLLIEPDEHKGMGHYYAAMAFGSHKPVHKAWLSQCATVPIAVDERKLGLRPAVDPLGIKSADTSPKQRSAQSDGFACLLCEDLGAEVVPFLRVENAANWVAPLMAFNRNLHDEHAFAARTMFRKGTNLWSLLYSSLFGVGPTAPLTPLLSGLVDGYLSRDGAVRQPHYWNPRFDLSMHVRHQRVFGGPTKSTIDEHALACAASALAAGVSDRNLSSSGPLRVFLATDNEVGGCADSCSPS
jgi:hypothetical protein